MLTAKKYLKASLILPTRNRASVLCHSLPRLLDQNLDKSDYEIIIADDDSADDTPALIRKIGSTERIVYLRLDKKMSAAGARNRAIGRARGEILVFVDDDCLVRPDFLAAHLKKHEGRENILTSGPIVEVTEIPKPGCFSVSRLAGYHCNPFPTGNASVKRRLVELAGGFDETFKGYGWEDTELFCRLKRLGVARRFTWKAPVLHYKSATVRSDFQHRLHLEIQRGHNGSRLYRKHSSWTNGLQTKQIRLFHFLDKLLNRWLSLDLRLDETRVSGAVPGSRILRWLLLQHVEIASGRAEWFDLQAEFPDTDGIQQGFRIRTEDGQT